MKLKRSGFISILALAVLGPMVRAQEPVPVDGAREAILAARKFNIDTITRPHDFSFSKLPEPDLVRDLMNYKKQALMRMGLNKTSGDTIIVRPKFGGWEFAGFEWVTIKKIQFRQPFLYHPKERQPNFKAGDADLNGKPVGIVSNFTP